MSLQYSPLCDTDIRAYALYLVANGRGVFGNCTECGDDCDGQPQRLCADDGCGDGVVSFSAFAKRKTWPVYLCQSLFEAGFCGRHGCGAGDAVPASVGVRGSSVCGGSGVVAGSVSDGLGQSGGSCAVSDGASDAQVQVDDGGVETTAPVYGPRGGLSMGRGLNYERNKRSRERRRESRRAASGVPEWRRGARGNGDGAVAVCELRSSLEAKWTAENALAKFKAERQLDLLKSQDVDEIRRMQRAQVLRTTETCKVQTEKAFASLLRSGNVPGGQVDGGGRVEGTVLTNSTPGLVRSAGDTISPDSSASMHEFRKCQKDLLDAEARNEKHVRTERRMAQVIERLKGLYPAEDPGVFDYSEPEQGITHYTLDSGGDLPAHAPDCFGYDNGKGQWRLSEPDYDGGNGFPY